MGKWSVAIADDNERMIGILDGILRQDEDIQIVGVARWRRSVPDYQR